MVLTSDDDVAKIENLFQVQPKAPLLQILRVAGAQEDVFTLKEVSCLLKYSEFFPGSLFAKS